MLQFRDVYVVPENTPKLMGSCHQLLTWQGTFWLWEVPHLKRLTCYLASASCITLLNLSSATSRALLSIAILSSPDCGLRTNQTKRYIAKTNSSQTASHTLGTFSPARRSCTNPRVLSPSRHANSAPFVSRAWVTSHKRTVQFEFTTIVAWKS